MEKKNLILLAAMAVAGLSCTEKGAEPVVNSELCEAFEIRAAITKTVLDTGTMGLSWEEGDCIWAVTTDKAWGADAAEDPEGSTIACYTCSSDRFATSSLIASGEHTFNFLYTPAANKTGHRGGGTVLTLGDQAQDCSAPTAHLKQYDALVGQATVTVPATVASVSMKHIYALMCVTLSNGTGAPLSLKSLNMRAEGATLVGTDAVIFGNEPSLSFQSGAADNVTVALTNCTIPADGTAQVWFVIRPQSAYSGNVTFTATASDDTPYVVTKAVSGLNFLAGTDNTCTVALAPAGPVFSGTMDLFLCGAGTEAGQKMNAIHRDPFDPAGKAWIKDLYSGVMTPEYEAYTRLEAGKDIYLSFGTASDNVSGYICFDSATIEALSDISLAATAPATGFRVESDGIYRIRVNMTTGKIVIQKLRKVMLRTFGREKNLQGNWARGFAKDFDLVYVGGGEWKLENFQVIWGNASFAERFDSYRFSFLFDADGKTQQYGMLDTSVLDNPTNETPANYWGVQLNDGGNTPEKGAYRWRMDLLDESVNPKYKVNIHLYMNYDQAAYYVHTITDKTEL
ncbi:MAG: fimbrillin family protein [Bacteroidales bacterium]|nr:fimbrillin family protein [Bacteroidales bacterium]